MEIISIEGGYATLKKTRESEKDIPLISSSIIIAPNDFAKAAMQLNRMIADGMAVENFLGILCSGATSIYLLVNDGHSDIACLEVAA